VPVGPPRDRPDDPDSDGVGSGDEDNPQTGGSGGLLDGLLQPGWYAETVVSAATQSRFARQSPSQETLAAQGGVAEFTGELPTESMLTGSKQTREDIQAVQDIFSGSGGGSLGLDEGFVTGGGGGGDGGDDSWL
jgi:hypothetical protein